jgi:hypothetical protein
MTIGRIVAVLLFNAILTLVIFAAVARCNGAGWKAVSELATR